MKGDAYTRADFVMYKRAEHALLVGRNIGYASWKKASAARRLSLAVANFKAAIDAVPAKYLAAADRVLLKELVREAAAMVA